jgi:hypothetical protein
MRNHLSFVMAGLVPAIPIRNVALYPPRSPGQAR